MAIIFRKNNSDTLLLFFNGWAADESMIPQHPEMDMCIISEWHTLQSLPYKEWQAYDKILLVAWSFGIVPATKLLATRQLTNITKSIAINGAPVFCDDAYGIPKAIFHATLEHLSPRSILKFMYRIMGSAKNYTQNPSLHNKRSFESLKKELLFFANENNIASVDVWDTVWLSKEDAIFPIANLRNYWASTSTKIIEREGAPHYPFLPPFSWKDLKI